jgi:fucose permease
VDAGLNHFVAEHYSSRHMNWLHGCWGVGATLGPVILGSAIGGTGWATGYRSIALIQLGLAAVFLASLPLWSKDGAVPEGKAEEENPGRTRALVPAWAAWLGPGLYLVYTSVETGTGIWAASILVGSRGMDAARASLAMSVFYGSIMAGRFLTGIIAEKAGNRRMVRLGLIVATAGSLVFIAAGKSPELSILGLGLLGLGCAPVYPCLMHETPRRYDEETTRKVVGRQVSFAYLGAALVPPAYGILAGQVGLEAIMPVVATGALLLLGLSELLNRVS